MNRYRWGFIGTGTIANEMAQAITGHGGSVYAAAGRNYERTLKFTEKYGIPCAYQTTEELLADPNVEIVYIASHNQTHYALAASALERDKHVLIEKPITLNSRELNGLIGLASTRKLIVAEAMTVWHMPLYRELATRIGKGKKMGRVQMINACFGSLKEYDMKNRYFSPAYAGGALLDIGGYALSAIRLFLTERPNEIYSQWVPSPARTDERETVILKNCAGEMAAATISLHSKQPKRVTVSCDNGYVEIWNYPRADHASVVYTDTGEKEELVCGNTDDALFYEFCDMENAVSAGDPSIMKVGSTRDVMDIMSQLRRSWGMCYPGETPATLL